MTMSAATSLAPGSRLAGTAQRAGRLVLDLLLPPNCLTCEAPVPEEGQLCVACFRATAFITEPLCVCCGVPFASAAQAGRGRLCLSCRDRPPLFAAARAALRYDAQSKRMLLPFKHGDRTEIAPALARMMARSGAALLNRAELLVPVPLHRRRLLARRYNQAALLAHALARISGRPAQPDALCRERPTIALGELTAAERAEIMDDAISVRPSRIARIADRRVLVVDDVMTSGATANACARVLLEAGARAVDVLVAARVPDPRLG